MKAYRLCALLLAISLALAAFLAAESTLCQQVRVYYQTKADWLILQRMHLDQIVQREGYIEIVSSPDQVAAIEKAGFRTEMIHADLLAFYRSRLQNKAMGNYKTLDEIYAYLDNIIAAYPTIVSPKVSIGKTIQGRDIWAVKISDNPTVDEDEPEVLYASCIHAREVITPEILLRVMDHLTQYYGIDPAITSLVDNRELWFVVMVNPDGYYRNQVTNPDGLGIWRKNRRLISPGVYGVDLNRNYGYEWGYDNNGSSPNPNDETYRGAGPFSEPETQAMRDFALSRHFKVSLYYHSFANLILWPWGYAAIYTPDNDVFAVMGDSISAMNGYTPEPSWGLYPSNGSSDDWHYGEQTAKEKTFAITIEAGNDDDAFWPPAERIEPLVAENLQPSLFVARIADNPYRLAPPGVPALTVADTVPAESYSVDWSLHDTLNPPVAYELVELRDYQIITDPAGSFANWETHGFRISSNQYSSAPASFYSFAGNSLSNYLVSQTWYRVGAGDTLRLKTAYTIEPGWDYAYVEVSTDGVNFTSLPGNITTNDDPNGNNRGNGITGASNGWIDARFDLSAYVGQKIYIRFSYVTDQAVFYEGFYVDDIYPTGIFGSQTSIYPISDTSYTYTDRPHGSYYYKVRARDAESQWSRYSVVAETYARSTYICGDANGDKAVNVGDAVYVINYVFKGGAAPTPAAAGDGNCDGATNVGDAVYVINFIFRGGSPPCCP